jgi:hypothetical protein
MQPGQFLVSKDGEKRKIFEVLNNLIAIENPYNLPGFVWMKKNEALTDGWSLLEEPWVPSLGERYYYLDSYGEIETEEKENNACFQHRTLVGNVHHTKTDAELYKQKLIERMGRDR